MDKRVKEALRGNLFQKKYNLEKTVEEYPELEEAKFYYAKTIINFKKSSLIDIEIAIELLKSIREYEKCRVYYQIVLGYEKINEFSKAKEWLYLLESSDDEIYRYRAIKKHAGICYKEGDTIGAIETYKWILGEDNIINLNKVKFNLGVVYSETGELEYARQLFSELLDTDFILNVKLELGKLEFKAANFEEALNYFKALKETYLKEDIIKDYEKLEIIVNNIKSNEENNNLEKLSKQKAK